MALWQELRTTVLCVTLPIAYARSHVQKLPTAVECVDLRVFLGMDSVGWVLTEAGRVTQSYIHACTQACRVARRRRS